jgi:hypothetical protein
MAEKPKKTAVRLTVDQAINGNNYRCNQAVILDAGHAAALVAQGQADDAKAAVNYAIEQSGPAISVEPITAAPEEPSE